MKWTFLTDVDTFDSVDPVDIFESSIICRHFQYRVENFFKVIVLNGPFG